MASPCSFDYAGPLNLHFTCRTLRTPTKLIASIYGYNGWLSIVRDNFRTAIQLFKTASLSANCYLFNFKVTEF